MSICYFFFILSYTIGREGELKRYLSHHMEEKQLALQAKKGDKQAFGMLYDTYVKEIYRFVYYKTHDKYTAEDLVTEIFIKALEKIHTYNEEKASFRTWLYTITRRTIIDHYRTVKTSVPIEDAWEITDNSDVQKKVFDAVEFAQMQEYMKLLSAEQRDIILLRLWEDLSFREIAEVLGKTEASCKMSFSRALKELKGHIPVTLFLLLITKLL